MASDRSDSVERVEGEEGRAYVYEAESGEQTTLFVGDEQGVAHGPDPVAAMERAHEEFDDEAVGREEDGRTWSLATDLGTYDSALERTSVSDRFDQIVFGETPTGTIESDVLETSETIEEAGFDPETDVRMVSKADEVGPVVVLGPPDRAVLGELATLGDLDGEVVLQHADEPDGLDIDRTTDARRELGLPEPTVEAHASTVVERESEDDKSITHRLERQTESTVGNLELFDDDERPTRAVTDLTDLPGDLETAIESRDRNAKLFVSNATPSMRSPGTGASGGSPGLVFEYYGGPGDPDRVTIGERMGPGLLEAMQHSGTSPQDQDSVHLGDWSGKGTIGGSDGPYETGDELANGSVTVVAPEEPDAGNGLLFHFNHDNSFPEVVAPYAGEGAGEAVRDYAEEYATEREGDVVVGDVLGPGAAEIEQAQGEERSTGASW